MRDALPYLPSRAALLSLRAWIGRWAAFLRAPARGPFWHEHPHR